MKLIGICGHYGFGKELLNGQTIKTKIVTNELINQLGNNEVQIVDSHNARIRMFQLIFDCIKLIKDCKNIIIMPANNGLKIFVPLFSILNRFYNRKLHYVVIGGWLVDFLNQNEHLRIKLKKFDGIYVETTYVKSELEKIGFNNVFILKNCKNLKILNVDQLIYQNEKPYKLCTFSRVMKEKGIEDAIKAVTDINEKNNKILYTLDIYGQIEDDYINQFNLLCNSFPSYIKYLGVVPYHNSVEILKNYFALLFPTQFATEGIPGTIIDAYSAGIPIISAKWNSFSDIIEDYKTGVGFELKNVDQFINILQFVANDTSILMDMKETCLKKAYEFVPKKVISDFINHLN